MKKELFSNHTSGRIAGMIGNLLEHYDSALFGLLAPFIAPLFFPESDPLTALILTYGLLPLGFLTRPIGAIFFGWIGDLWGRRQALFCSLLGIAFVTLAMGSLPVYADIGILAPILLALGKMLQSFFIAGEAAGGAIFVLENTDNSKRSLNSSIFDSLSVIGILLASALIALISSYGNIEEHWRIPFWLGGITAFAGFLIRWKLAPDKPNHTSKPPNWLTTFKEHKRALLLIALATGFSYATYHTAFTLMNGYIPLVTSLSKSDVMKVNTALLIVDMLLLPCFGYLADKIGKEKVMFSSAILTSLVAIPLFSLLDNATFFTVIMVRVVIILLGIAFAAPYHAWALEQVPKELRYRILSLGSALGSQLIGMPTSAISLWLYKESGWTAAPGIYLMLISFAASCVIWKTAKRPVQGNVFRQLQRTV